MNGMQCIMSPLMKWTSLESLSSFATATEHLRLRAMLRALASCGRSSSASAPLSVSILVNSATIRSPFACAKRSNASRWASSPRPNPFFPDRACFSVANPIVGNDRLHAGTSAAMGYFNAVVGAFASLLSSKTAARYKGLSKPSADTTPQGAWFAGRTRPVNSCRPEPHALTRAPDAPQAL